MKIAAADGVFRLLIPLIVSQEGMRETAGDEGIALRRLNQDLFVAG